MSTATETRPPTQMQMILQTLLDSGGAVHHDALVGDCDTIPENSLCSLLSKLRSDKIITSKFIDDNTQVHTLINRDWAEQKVNTPPPWSGGRVHRISDEEPTRKETVAHSPGFTDRSAAHRAGKAAGANGATHALPEAQPEPQTAVAPNPAPAVGVPMAPNAANEPETSQKRIAPEPAKLTESSPSSEQRVSPAVVAAPNRFGRAADLLKDWGEVCQLSSDDGNDDAARDAADSHQLSGWLRAMPDVHPAFLGLLGTLPPPGTRMSEKRQFALTTALAAIVEFFYGEA